ncbi:MAG TPA: hypothetical protein VNH18_25620, partial [Bryobacteraceae bacterium]|nr:hypothetical protein [Bryobacteraceae bacterium]
MVTETVEPPGAPADVLPVAGLTDNQPAPSPVDADAWYETLAVELAKTLTACEVVAPVWNNIPAGCGTGTGRLAAGA